MSRNQKLNLLRYAECQCLHWELAVAKGEPGAKEQLAKWEAEYNIIEGTL